MTLDQLRVLQAIKETGSFRSASEVLHKAQSAISYAVKNLEDELNITILDREGYRSQFTKEGEAVCQKAKQIITKADELMILGKHLSAGKEVEIRLAINAICPLSDIIDVIKRFSQSNQLTRILLNLENLGGSIERLLDDDAEIALSEVMEWNENLESIPWTKIEFLPVAAADFPLAQINKPLDVSDMIKHVQIIVSDSSQHLEKKTVGVLKDGIHWTVNNFSLKKSLLLSGCGWGLMPKHIVLKELNQGYLTELNTKPFINMEVDFFLIRKKRPDFGPISTDLWHELAALKSV